MLVLSRKQGQEIRIGDRITITVVRAGRGCVKLGIDAPANLPIVRTEIDSRPPRAADAARRKAG